MLLPTIVLKIVSAGVTVLSKGLHTSRTSLQAKQRVTKPLCDRRVTACDRPGFGVAFGKPSSSI